MSIDAIAYVKTLPVGDPTLRLLLWAIAENTFNDSFLCKVGNLVLSEDVGVHERTIRRRLEELEDAKRIRRHACPGTRGRLHDNIEIIGFKDWLLANRPHRVKGGQPDNLSGSRGSESASDSESDDATRLSNEPDNLPAGQPDRTPVSGSIGQQVSGPYKDSSRTRDPGLSPPLPPAGGSEGGGEGTGNSAEAIPLVAELLAEGQPAHVADGLVGWLLRSGLQPWKDVPSVIGAARQLCIDLAPRRVAVIEAARAAIRKSARYRLPPPADILAAVDAAEKAYDADLAERVRAQRAVDERCAADPELARRTEALRAALRLRVGDEVFSAWFHTIACEGYEPAGGGRLTVSIAMGGFVRKWVQTHYEQVLAQAAAEVLGPVTWVEVAAAPAARVAA